MVAPFRLLNWVIEVMDGVELHVVLVMGKAVSKICQTGWLNVTLIGNGVSGK